LEQLWPGARIFDHHGMTETGPISHECPARPGVLHVIESAYLPEVLDSGGNPVPVGEIGELVVTTLTRVASPLLRYRTGDLVRVVASPDTPCECGRCDLALAGGILGRADDMIIIRGVNLYPSAVEEVMRGFEEIVEYQAQVIQSATLSQLALQIELRPGADGASADKLIGHLQDKLHTTFNLRVPVNLAPVGTLPRFEMKARRWQITTG
jgi:phenylacetate-CoA ligase